MEWVNGIKKTEHGRLHKKLIRDHGNATKCEGENCTHKNPKRFEWALKKGHSYSANPEDYLQLCVSCHRKYDFTEEIREKLKARKFGENHNGAKLTELDVLAIYTLIAMGYQNKLIAGAFKVDPSTICDIKRGKRWRHLKSSFTT